jgi:hypothetical protein
MLIRLNLARALCFTLLLAPAAFAQSDNEKPARLQIQEQAEKLKPLVKSKAVKEFLEATKLLPEVNTRILYLDKENNEAYNEAEAKRLPEEKREKLDRLEYDEEFYYFTRYGSPMIYARPLDIVAQVASKDGAEFTFQGKSVFDFGYGLVGHLRLLATLGARTVGTEVYPVLRALYSYTGDQGHITGTHATGTIKLIHGRYPAEPDVEAAVGAGFDIIISKNVLKRGYIHPEREADPRATIDLGVDDATFASACYDALNPGGLIIIYNISPKQNPADQPFIPWADGRCPFDKDLLEKIGFKTIAYDQDDQKAILDLWMALGYNQDQSREALATDLFAHYTLLQRPKTQEPKNPNPKKTTTKE